MIDEKTPNLQLPLPNKQNLLSIDAERITTAFSLVDGAMAGLQTAFEEFKQAILASSAEEQAKFSQHFQTLSESNAQQLRQFANELNKIKVLAMAGL